MPKTIVITGTASGMGRATVSKFAAEGWNVVAIVRKESDLQAHAGHRCVKTVLLDVDDEGAVPFAQRALEQFGRVDALVNNAGYYQMGPLEGTNMEQVRRQYQTNVFSVAALIKAFLPAFRAQHSVADRVAERRGGVRVQAAQRDIAGNPAVAGSADHVAMVNHDLGHRTVARDKHQHVGGAAPVPGPWSRAAVPDVIGIRRLPGRGATTRGRGPGLEASADSGEG
jgi:NAD(P)-dependent dehydrogenase (short-subunit alcohol dehydrogenase family)